MKLMQQNYCLRPCAVLDRLLNWLFRELKCGMGRLKKIFYEIICILKN